MSTVHNIYQFWINQQTVPGNILGDVLIGGATFLVGKYKVAPWLHARHKEQLAQSERQHKELLLAHQALLELHERHHRELLHPDPGGGIAADGASPTTADAPGTGPLASDA